MYALKAFVAIDGLADNSPGALAPIGELSSYSASFSKEKGFYNSDSFKDIQIVSFMSKVDDVIAPMPAELKDDIFDFVGWIYGQILANVIMSDNTTFVAAAVNEKSAIAINIEAGAIVSNGTYAAPEWVSWQLPNDAGVIRVWFSDTAFSAQYDEYEIIVVPPVDNLDKFFRDSAQVSAALNAMSITTMTSKLQLAKEGHPETIIKIEMFNYIDPTDATVKIPTRWGILIYGPAGDNSDSIKDALVKYILANSTHPREDWIPILPDIFRRTEFIITPLWGQYGIPNRTLEAGIYSPLAKVSEALSLAKQTATEYLPVHVESYLSIMDHPYKSLIMAIVGGPENREGKFYLTDFYTDLISVGTSTPDFSRMTVNTQAFAEVLATLIYQAESLTKYTVLPYGLSKVTRGGVLYVAKTIDNVQFLVAAKNNFAGV